MVGLLRSTVALEEDHENWAILFELECARLQEALGTLAVEIHHVGSTSVSGLPAKPIIDILLIVESLSVVSQLLKPLALLGWIDRGLIHPGDHLFVLESKPEIRTHHLHVVEASSAHVKEYLVFKKALLESPAVLERYKRIKEELAEQHKNNRAAYTASKADFVRKVVAKNK